LYYINIKKGNKIIHARVSMTLSPGAEVLLPGTEAEEMAATMAETRKCMKNAGL
jgi:hypothetical protein